MSLFHPLWNNSGLLEDIARDEIPETKWFANSSIPIVILNVIIPLLALILLGFWLKDKYIEQQEIIRKRRNIRKIIEGAIRS